MPCVYALSASDERTEPEAESKAEAMDSKKGLREMAVRLVCRHLASLEVLLKINLESKHDAIQLFYI